MCYLERIYHHTLQSISQKIHVKLKENHAINLDDPGPPFIL